MLAHQRATAAGAGVLLRVRNPQAGTSSARLSVGYGDFAQAYGGSYGSRLALYEVPACALDKKLGGRACPGRPKPLASTNDVKTQTVSAPLAATSTGTLVALAAADASAQGDYKATGLARRPNGTSRPPRAPSPGRIPSRSSRHRAGSLPRWGCRTHPRR